MPFNIQYFLGELDFQKVLVGNIKKHLARRNTFYGTEIHLQLHNGFQIFIILTAIDRKNI